MRKFISRFLFIAIAALWSVNPTNVLAQSVLNITPEATIANLNLTGISTITYTVVNDTKHPIDQLTVDPTYLTTGNITGINLLNNLCAGVTLPPNGNCTFQALVLRPRVCGYNGAVCSTPLAANEVHVSSAPHIAFVTNFANNTLSVCNINSDGTFDTCTQLQDPSFDGPSGVTLNAIGTFVGCGEF
jgi:hypothetical protein